MSNCPGGDKCRACNVPDDKCSIVNTAQMQNLWKVVGGEMTSDESCEDLNERFPSGAILGGVMEIRKATMEDCQRCNEPPECSTKPLPCNIQCEPICESCECVLTKDNTVSLADVDVCNKCAKELGNNPNNHP